MVSFEIRTLDGTVSAEVRARVVEVLVDGFSHDIALLDMTGDDPALSPLIYSSWVDATLHSGEIDTAVVDGIIQGVALWFGPGEEMLGTPEQTRLGWDEVFGKFTPHLARWWKEDYPPQMRTCEQLCGNVHKSGWYLGLLAVDSTQQRKGLGATLLRYGIARAEKDQVPVVLECEPENVSNVRLGVHKFILLLDIILRALRSPSHGDPVYQRANESMDVVRPPQGASHGGENAVARHTARRRDPA